MGKSNMLKKVVTTAALAVLAFSTANAQTTEDLRFGTVKIDSITQSAAISFGADLGFPDGVQGAVIQLDCRSGNVGTLPMRNATPEQLKKLMALNYAKGTPGKDGEISIPMNSKEKYRFFCKDGVVYWDFSSATKEGMSSLLDSNANITSISQSLIGEIPMFMFIPGPGITTRRFTINAMNLAKAREIVTIENTGYDGRDTGDGPNSQEFFLASDGKTLLPFSSRTTFPLPIKTGKGGSVVTIYRAGDYTKPENWFRTVIDFANYNVSTVTVTKPADLVFGR